MPSMPLTPVQNAPLPASCASLPLARHSVIETRDLDEVREQVARYFWTHRIDLDRRREKLDARFHHAPLCGASLNYIRYGGDVTVDAGESPNCYMAKVVLEGNIAVERNNQTLHASAGQAVLTRPDQYLKPRFSSDAGILVLKIPNGLIDDRLAEDGLNRLTAFPDHTVPLTGPLKKFRLTLDLLRQDLDGTEPTSSPVACADYQETLIAALMEGWPGHRPANTERAISPRAVRQAVDYIHAHAEEEIRVDDLAKAAGASTSILFDAFRKHMNCGPMAYVRAVRLRSARRAIINRDDPRSVTEIALDCGFLHLGRFSTLFRMAYGETPSQARRRVRH